MLLENEVYFRAITKEIFNSFLIAVDHQRNVFIAFNKIVRILRETNIPVFSHRVVIAHFCDYT